MKFLLLVLLALLPTLAFCQVSRAEREEVPKINQLISDYSKARETRDTILLKEILTEDIDQLVSSGEWRNGLRAAIQGMMQSSTANPGTRTLEVEKIKFLSDEIALVDCRYLIKSGETVRNMWSSFTLVFDKDRWKISAIRNMNPTGT
ncbi:nuclear transport factor 2 family protein [Algoriphagus sp. H41]|uniref:Nuclear transport factor 2 family protein n=1 Tax=Algoriphagus oliviformis TaxID=2811231 RepID=A0ABS3C2F8_9BACT|nr:nuclear transport factor 2 family protein [Algoriphagus oliviformis]MBN7811127.1 nuclear transport factor 2 family protein [Algoriphagus oliviformis]